MPNARRTVSRTPTPKLQPRPSADRVRRTNISISKAQQQQQQQQQQQRQCTIVPHRDRDDDATSKNKSDGSSDTTNNSSVTDDYWHRQEVGTSYSHHGGGSSYSSQSRSQSQSQSQSPLLYTRTLKKRLKSALPVLTLLFICLLLIDSMRLVNREQDSSRVMQTELEHSFRNYDTNVNHPPEYESPVVRHDDYGQRKNPPVDERLAYSARDNGGGSNNRFTAMKEQRHGEKDAIQFDGLDGIIGGDTNIDTRDIDRGGYLGQNNEDAQYHLSGNTQKQTTTTQESNPQQDTSYLTQHNKIDNNSRYGSTTTRQNNGEPSKLRYSPGIPLPNQHVQEKMDFIGKNLKKKKFKPTKQLLNQVKTAPHSIAGLDCLLYGGGLSSPASSQELVYWHDIPSDAEYTSPFYYSKQKQHPEVNIMDDDMTPKNQRSYHRMEGNNNNEIARDSMNKYITFEPDNAGWNNQRMAFETILTLSAAMGRTLVLPPRQGLPLLSEGSHGDRMLSYDDFYHLDSLNKEYEGINIITTEEFLLREGVNGNLFKYGTSDSMYVPGNRTSWDDLATDVDDLGSNTPLASLWDYIRSVSYIPKSWNPNECIVAFPATPGPEGNVGLSTLMEDILLEKDRRPKPQHLDFQGKPIPTNAAPIERLREMMAGRSRLCLYDDEMQSAAVVHFPYLGPNSKSRLLTHFYSFVFFEQWRQATWTNRLIRDHIRYRDEIMCAAARVTEAVHEYSMQHGSSNGLYDSMHIRRNDFQNSDLPNISEEEIFDSLSDVDLGSTIFVATDEKRDIFFTRLHERYNLVFLKDFRDLLGINANYYGMVEQIVASRGNQFYGTFYSTFSGHISRLRGYYTERDKLLGYDEGKLMNTYFMPRIYRNELRIYQAIQRPFFAREFPIAWKDTDRGIGEMIWKGW